ncbi:hypothetical protein [Microcoleus sp. B3-D7]|uniref:hypothetical protein n=1 Tax=Microcoleus sp. B3-D7 TaxID=2818659 RepID=UPI002FD16C7D
MVQTRWGLLPERGDSHRLWGVWAWWGVLEFWLGLSQTRIGGDRTWRASSSCSY